MFIAASAGAEPWALALLVLLGLVPASDIAVALVHRLVPALLPPRRLPKLELAEGVPPELRTLVAVPTLLTDHADLEQQLERLEVHYLANPEGHLHFALLTDWPDADEEHAPGDDELIAALDEGIERLNAHYEGPPGGGARFLVLHRRRLWNEQEGKWIGWERKRGKLHELNRLLRGATDTTSFRSGGGRPALPAGVRYVITLDADTRLPKGAAYRLVGAMAHPLNRPRFDPQLGRVVEGYAVLQPRITPSLPTGPGSTTFQRIVSGPGGVDPYAAAISDVYQDLFDEGSYTGKGIYDVDAFEAALEGKIPENALLSHDLFEGLFARAGLLTDVDLFEEFPSNYEVAARRQHRWVRGDWQLLPWILGRAGYAAGRELRAQIPVQGRWKMIDNLRRSSRRRQRSCWPWPRGRCRAFLLCSGRHSSSDPSRSRRSSPSSTVSSRSVGESPSAATCAPWRTICSSPCRKRSWRSPSLAHQAWLNADAVVRTLVRLYVTRRNLLEWVPAAQAGYGADLRLRAFYRHLRGAVVVAASVGLLVVAIGDRGLARGRAVRPALGAFASPRLAHQPPSEARRGADSLAAGDSLAPAHRPPHVALLRDLRRRSRELPPAGQLPGGSRAGHRPPHLADEHRPLSAEHDGRP